QPAVFVHSVAQFVAQPGLQPAMVAGHSLGEFSALVAAGVLSFADALPLVARRAQAMQAACEEQPGTMAAILGLADDVVERPARCPVYQNVDGAPHSDPAEIKANLLAQLTAPVRWTQSVQAMVADGAVTFLECGPGKGNGRAVQLPFDVAADAVGAELFRPAAPAQSGELAAPGAAPLA
nr:malonyl-CoA-acyl carrier protein transacylase, mitochondrial [Tanacetum cinerariifolium]